MQYILIVLLAMSFFSCKSSKSDMNGEINFETVIQTPMFGSENAENLVIQSKEDLSKFVVSNGNKTPKELLAVDLEKNTVVMVNLGQRNNGGYGIEIKKLVADKDKVTVFYMETEPEKGAMVTMALTYPMHAVKIEKTNKNIVFEKMTAN